MADPFEVRLRFTSLLTHLSASSTSATKTASFALKHCDMDEDLHSCILESLDPQSSTSMNSRANIMYFLETFCDMAAKKPTGEGHENYVAMVRRDINDIVNGVVGRLGSGGGGANIKVARKVVDSLKTKGVLDEACVQELEADLKLREQERSRYMGGEASVHHKGRSDEDADTPADASISENDSQPQQQRQRHNHSHQTSKSTSKPSSSSKQPTSRTKDANTTNTSTPTPASSKPNGSLHKVDKRAIEQRIEEDRERNKRLRESVWAVDDNENELAKLWDETSDLNDDDYVIAREEAEERQQFARYHKTLLVEGRDVSGTPAVKIAGSR